MNELENSRFLCNIESNDYGNEFENICEFLVIYFIFDLSKFYTLKEGS